MPYNIIKKLNWRYATKKFDTNKKVSKKDFDTLLEVLRLSASSFGLQPWKFVVVKDKKIREKLRPFAWNQSQITDASHLIVICSIKDIDEKFLKFFFSEKSKTIKMDSGRMKAGQDKLLNFIKTKTDQERKSWLKRQGYIALGNLLTAAATLKIDTCPIEGLEHDKFNEILKLDKYDIETTLACAIGYRAKDDQHAKEKKFRFPKSKLFVEI